MEEKILREILEVHNQWVEDHAKGKRADLSGVDLSGVDLSGVNLCCANLSCANLSGAILSSTNLHGACMYQADLSHANLDYANLSCASLCFANLCDATLCCADLSNARLNCARLTNANLNKANLCGADLSGAIGLVDAATYLEQNFAQTAEGYVVYKTFGSVYHTPKTWDVTPGAIIEEICNPSRTEECGSGINVAPLSWVKKCYSGTIYKLLIRWAWLPGVVVPYNSCGNIRCAKAEIIGKECLWFKQ